MKDWKGNKIVAGQTLVLVRTKPIFSEYKMIIFDPKEGKTEQIGETITPTQYVWEVVNEVEIWEDKDGKLFYTLQLDDYKCDVELSILFWMSNSVVCIKGVSDNEQDYYTNYFKT